MIRIEKQTLRAGAAAIALLLGACANLDTVPAGTAATDLAATRGKPFRIWPESGGAASWEYPLGPAGRTTYMVRVGADGHVTRVDQVLGWSFFGELHPGMKDEDIEHVLGRPYSRTYMPTPNETILAWRWMETVWPRCFYAHLAPNGTLARTSVRDEDVSDHGVLTSSPC